MKTILLTFSLFVISTLALASGGEAGGGGGGGGDALHSTPAEVEAYIFPKDLGQPALAADVIDLIGEVIWQLNPNHGIRFRDPQVPAMLTAIAALPYFDEIRANGPWGVKLKNVTFRTTRSSCQDPISREFRDASVRAVGNHAEICLSSKRLSRFPVRSYKHQFTAIVLHEFAHLAGYGESQAQQVQQFVTDKIKLGRTPDASGCHVEIRFTETKNTTWPFSQIFVKQHSVSFNRPLVSGRGGLSATLVLEKEDLKLNWAPGGDGKIEFKLLDLHENVTTQSLEFSRLTDPGVPYHSFYATDFKGSTLKINGRAITPKILLFSSDCYL